MHEAGILEIGIGSRSSGSPIRNSITVNVTNVRDCRPEFVFALKALNQMNGVLS